MLTAPKPIRVATLKSSNTKPEPFFFLGVFDLVADPQSSTLTLCVVLTF